jgi:citrate lyase beta subunit
MEATFLFVPAHEERKALGALRSGCDAVIFDLEAAVPECQKHEARQSVRRYFHTLRKSDGPGMWVRVNGKGPHMDADVESIEWSEADGAVVAQAEDPSVLQLLADAGAKRLIPMIETANGFAALASLAQVPGVERFAIGTWDLLLDLGLLAVNDPDQSELIWQLRGDLVVGSRQLGLQAPIDGVYARLDGTEFQAICTRVHQLGYAAKLLIHPSQVQVARLIFGPDEERLRHARLVLDAYERAVVAGTGVVRVDGMMVDSPMAERARALLSRWPRAMTS